MDLSSAVYGYHFSNVTLVSSAQGIADWILIAAFVLLGIVTVVAGPYVYGYSVYRSKEAEKLEKKRMVRDFLLMKEIQNELEEEMRKTITNAKVS